MIIFEISIVLMMMLLNGIFAMSELAIVSAKKVLLRKKAGEGSKAAAQALAFADDTSKFLPAVQVGITLVGIFSGAFSGATLAGYVATWLIDSGMAPETAQALSISIIVMIVTYLTLIIGELVPKELALRNPEKVAMFVAPIIHVLSRCTWPVIIALSRSTNFMLWALRVGNRPETTVTQEEVSAMIREGAHHGIFGESERGMLSGVMLLADKPVRAFMVPRGDVVAFDCDTPPDEIKKIITASPYSRFPVRSPDDEDVIVGIVHAKDVMVHMMSGHEFDLNSLIRRVAIFPDTTNTLTVIEYLRKEPLHTALVVDRHGGFEGIVTLADLLYVIMGSMGAAETEGDEIVVRDDGSWLIDGSLLIEPTLEKIGLPVDPTSEFHTVAGFMLHNLRSMPRTGDNFIYRDHRFEVVDMDGHRIDKILVSKIDAAI